MVHDIIESESFFEPKKDLENILKIIKKIEYSKFKELYIKFNGNIYIRTKDLDINAKVYSLSDNKSNNSNNIEMNFISDKLKALLLLAITQNIDTNSFKELSQKKLEKVYLINYNYLKQYKFDEISILLKKIKDIDKYAKDFNNSQNTYDPNNLEEIISKIDNKKLSELDKEIQKTDLSKTDWKAKYDTIKLKNQKTVNCYKNFVIINEKIYNEIKHKLSLYSSNSNFEYINASGRDILAINDYSKQYIIIGNLFNYNHSFNLSYIIYLDHQYYLTKEIEFIQKGLGLK